MIGYPIRLLKVQIDLILGHVANVGATRPWRQWWPWPCTPPLYLTFVVMIPNLLFLEIECNNRELWVGSGAQACLVEAVDIVSIKNVGPEERTSVRERLTASMGECRLSLAREWRTALGRER